ncbi:L,D-transpeptidase family protein [Sporolactobacillus vineae]|uniref:L,D-transpeptidase family protein n=1 Tax=Sporolactobacillus vineae TaxID=444463 RepID=UPI000287B0D0|nr:L,D-transpeptidase family protein [Sporolactobacillus vineae]
MIAGISYHQATHFNAHVTVNGTPVGGMTPDQAVKKLSSETLRNELYIGNKLILNGKDTKTGFNAGDLAHFQKLLKQQWTWWPSGAKRHFSLLPEKTNRYPLETMKKEAEAKIKALNKTLKAPKDAEAVLVNGRIQITPSVAGNQYNIRKLLKAYEFQKYSGIIRLKPVLLEPVKADSTIVKNEKKKLQNLLGQSVSYQLQGKPFEFKAADLIRNAQVSKDLKYTIDTREIKGKLAELNKTYSTLNKDFAFRTHSGGTISVRGQSYGWALNVSQEARRVEQAFVKGTRSLKAYNVYGVGYSTYGIGYHTTANHGIGFSYAEVSIRDQRVWIYKNGRMVLTTHVVTGRHNTHEDTPKGLWYIEYKQSPSVLRGSEAGNLNYAVKVKYWAPFTMGGVGFHDAGWRRNWSSAAYLTQGSGGCVNTPPEVMGQLFGYLEQNEPVVVY